MFFPAKFLAQGAPYVISSNIFLSTMKAQPDEEINGLGKYNKNKVNINLSNDLGLTQKMIFTKTQAQHDGQINGLRCKKKNANTKIKYKQDNPPTTLG